MPTTHPLELMVIEDNTGDFKLLEHAARLSGLLSAIELIHFADGESSAEFLQTQQTNQKKLPDLIFLDIQLPRMSGFDVLNQMKRNEILHAIPVFMFSNSSGERDILMSKELGASGYIQKPIDFNELIQLCDLIRKSMLDNPDDNPAGVVKCLQQTPMNLFQSLS